MRVFSLGKYMKQEAYEATAAAVASKATYGGAGGSFAGFMLSNEFVALVGLLIALAGFLVNWHYRAAQDRRDQIEHEARLRRGEGPCAHDK